MRDELDKALDFIDWEQVVSNGGPPCFHVEYGTFCLRARYWVGHDKIHAYKDLKELIEGVRRS